MCLNRLATIMLSCVLRTNKCVLSRPPLEIFSRAYFLPSNGYFIRHRDKVISIRQVYICNGEIVGNFSSPEFKRQPVVVRMMSFSSPRYDRWVNTIEGVRNIEFGSSLSFSQPTLVFGLLGQFWCWLAIFLKILSQ